MAGENGTPRHRVAKVMTNADKPTPPNGESVSDASVDYESIGQRLLQAELERHADELAVSFRQTAQQVRRGEDVDAEDLAQLRSELNSAVVLVELVEEAMSE
jgi:tRNA threonylcarbamoyladenosine modification (KEOPS) complex  Pcc1 subunit